MHGRKHGLEIGTAVRSRLPVAGVARRGFTLGKWRTRTHENAVCGRGRYGAETLATTNSCGRSMLKTTPL